MGATAGAEMKRKSTDNSTPSGSGNRDRFRDNDDQRNQLSGDERWDVKPDSKGEARGSARQQAGNNARGTDASPVGPEGNDRTRRRPRADDFDEDLSRDA